MKLDPKKNPTCTADQCKNNGICQSEGGQPYCRISETIGEKVYFTETRHPMGCPYQHSFGSAFMCTCPVRQEIYRKHKI